MSYKDNYDNFLNIDSLTGDQINSINVDSMIQNGGIPRGKISNLSVDTLDVSTSGYIKSGKSSFIDTVNPGWYQSSEGIYFGAAGDSTYLKYSINPGTFVIKAAIDGDSTIGGRTASTIASAIDASGHFADNAINTATGTIAGDFTFGVSGALQIGEYINGTSGDVRISPNGILARDKSGANTFSIDGTTGVAVLNGLVVGTNVGLGTAKDSAGVTTIIGDTVTTGFVNALNIEAETMNVSTSGYLRSGKVSFTDTVNGGWYQSKEGIYFGTAGDTKSLKYDVSAGTIVFKGVDLSWSDITGAGKPANNATVGATWNSNISGQPAESSILNPSYITSTKITSTTIESPTITAGTITGTLLQTTSSSNSGVKISSALGGMNVYGENINVYDTSGTHYGTIGSGGAYLDIASISNRNIRISPWGGSVFFGLNSGSGIAPASSGTGNLGLSSHFWSNAYINNINVGADGYYLNKDGNTLKLNEFTHIGVGGYEFKEVGFTFKDGTGANRYIVVLAAGDPT